MLIIALGFQESLREQLQKKIPDMSPAIDWLRGETITVEHLISLIHQPALFGGNKTYGIRDGFEYAEVKNYVMHNKEDLHTSPHLFLFVEESLPAAEQKKLSAYIMERETDVITSAEANPFYITQLLATKKQPDLWIEYIHSVDRGEPIESIHGRLWWQLKTLALVKAVHPHNPGMKDYPFRQAQKNQKLFSQQELEIYLRKMIDMYHQGHVGEIDLKIGLEQLILSIK